MLLRLGDRVGYVRSFESAEMLASALRYCLRRPFRALSAVAADLVDTWIALQQRIAARYDQPVPPPDLYRADPNWKTSLHNLLGISWPCQATLEFNDLWPQVVAELMDKGVQVGPESFKSWNDGDGALVRAIWCLTRHLQPRNVVETGVAHGMTSRFILEALDRNGVGHLWSIDRAPLDDAWHDEIGVAVGGRYPDRWSYISGSSKRRLPDLLSNLNPIDLFIHDSLHSAANVRFETDLVWAALRAGGAIVVDDIDASWGFHGFTQKILDCPFMVCEAEPLRPDLRRFNEKGLFGIALKLPTAPPGKSF